MKKTLFVLLLVTGLAFSFERVSETQTKPEQIKTPHEENKPQIVVRKSGEPPELPYDTGTIRFLVNSEDTHGAFSMVEVNEKPGRKTSWHRHNDWDESFYVLEGVLTAKIEDKIYELSAGSYILIPRGTPHGQGNFGKTPVKLLLTIRPSGFEQFFKDRVELFKTIKPGDPLFQQKIDELRAKNKKYAEPLGTWDIEK